MIMRWLWKPTLAGLSVLVVTVGSAQAQAPERESRLKFRSGPTCMCSQGLSEADIRRAEEQQSFRNSREFLNRSRSRKSDSKRGEE